MRYLFEDREGDEGLPGRRRRVATLCILVFTATAMLDLALVTIALPTIATSLRITESESVWIVSSYQLAGAVSILTFSALGAILGFRRIFVSGLLVFALASLGCALSSSFAVLLVLRFLQGLGAAAAMCVTAALYRLIYPRRLLGSALGINALVVGAAMAAGPTLGGVIVSTLSWKWLFIANVPLALGALWAISRALPNEPPCPRPFDVAGAASSAIGVGCLLLAAYQLARPGGLYIGALLLAMATLSGLAFVRVQRKARAPLLRLDIFRNQHVTRATVTSIIANIGQGLALVALPFLFQGRYGLSPAAAGLLFTPLPVAIMLAAPLSGRLADRYGSRPLVTGGLATLALGFASIGAADFTSVPIAGLGFAVFVCGFGFGLFQTPNNREFMGSVDDARLGAASGLLTFSRSVGLTLGTVVAALVALVAHHPAIPAGARAASAHTMSVWLAAAAAVLATAFSALRPRHA
jgi:DHA2 family multidrug resistance protein-like MFS transporter